MPWVSGCGRCVLCCLALPCIPGQAVVPAVAVNMKRGGLAETSTFSGVPDGMLACLRSIRDPAGWPDRQLPWPVCRRRLPLSLSVPFHFFIPSICDPPFVHVHSQFWNLFLHYLLIPFILPPCSSLNPPEQFFGPFFGFAAVPGNSRP